jgi:hypothetical protein
MTMQLTLIGTVADAASTAIDTEFVERLVLDAGCARAYLALEAAGVDRRGKLTTLVAEVRPGLDAATWLRWCRLAGLDVARADELAHSRSTDGGTRL